MPCQAYSPQAGVFSGPLVWGQVGSGVWSFRVTAGATQSTVSLLRANAAVASIAVPNEYTARWGFFPGGSTFAMVRAAALAGAGPSRFRCWVFDLRSNVVPNPIEIEHGPYEVLANPADLKVNVSPDGRIIFVRVVDEQTATISVAHRIIRTDTGALVMEYGQIDSPEFRAAEVTPDRTLRIFTAPVPQPGPGTGTTVLETQLPAPLAVTGGTFNPAGTDLPKEHVVVENCDTTPVELRGWTLRDRSGHIYTFPNFTLGSKGAVNVWTKRGPNSQTDLFMNRDAPVWTNTGDVAILRDQAGQEISRYDYPGGVPGGGGGRGGGSTIPAWNVDLPPVLTTVTADVPEDTTGIDTGIDVQDGDWLEIGATGHIYAGVTGTGQNPPSGWDNVDHDPKFPLHTGPNAHPYSLIGYLDRGGSVTGPFYVGDSYLSSTVAGFTGRLFLRTNDDIPGGGNGAFRAVIRLRRRGAPPPGPPTTTRLNVPESSSRVDTGVDLEAGDTLEITGGGAIHTGVFGWGETGPEGAAWLDHDKKFPLNRGQFARPYALIGFVRGNGDSPPFYVGNRYGPTRPPRAGRLYLRTNDDAPGNGDGAFTATIHVWN
jgi:hypothetical protein